MFYYVFIVWVPKGISATKGGTVVLPLAKHRRVPLVWGLKGISATCGGTVVLPLAKHRRVSLMGGAEGGFPPRPLIWVFIIY